jgi:hypothetical protein
VIAWLAKSPATRRTGEELTLVRLPGGEVIPNRRNPPPGD